MPSPAPLPDNVEVVDAVGDGVLVIEIAITDATPNKDFLGTKPTRPGLRASNYRSVGVGGAAMEAILTDSTGEAVALLADDWTGRTFSSNTNLHSRWGDARDAFRKWGREIGKLLD